MAIRRIAAYLDSKGRLRGRTMEPITTDGKVGKAFPYLSGDGTLRMKYRDEDGKYNVGRAYLDATGTLRWRTGPPLSLCGGLNMPLFIKITLPRFLRNGSRTLQLIKRSGFWESAPTFIASSVNLGECSGLYHIAAGQGTDRLLPSWEVRSPGVIRLAFGESIDTAAPLYSVLLYIDVPTQFFDPDSSFYEPYKEHPLFFYDVFGVMVPGNISAERRGTWQASDGPFVPLRGCADQSQAAPSYGGQVFEGCEFV